MKNSLSKVAQPCCNLTISFSTSCNTLIAAYRRPSERHDGARSPRRRSYSPTGRRPEYRTHPSRETGSYPLGSYEPRSVVVPGPHPTARGPNDAWPDMYDAAPRREPVRRSHSELAPLRAEAPWDDSVYDRQYAPAHPPPSNYHYTEPEYSEPAYRQAPIRHEDPRDHPYAQQRLEVDYRQPLYPNNRDPHVSRGHSYRREVEVVHEPYVRSQPAWETLRNDGYDLQKHPAAHHAVDDRWHDAQPDRQPSHAAPRGSRHAPRYTSDGFERPGSDAGYHSVSRHPSAEPQHPPRSIHALDHAAHQELQPAPPLRREDSRVLQRHASSLLHRHTHCLSQTKKN